MANDSSRQKLREILANSQAAAFLTNTAEHIKGLLEDGKDYRQYLDEGIIEVWHFVLDFFKGEIRFDACGLGSVERYSRMVSERANALKAYLIEADVTDEVIGTYYNERIMPKSGPAVNEHKVLDEIMSYVLADAEEDEQGAPVLNDEVTDRMAEVLDILPVPWTKQDFFDYVADALRSEFEYKDEEMADEIIQSLKQSFTGRLEANYGVFFPDIAAKIDKLQQLKPLKQSDAELSAARDELVMLFDDIAASLGFCITLKMALRAIQISVKYSIDLAGKWAPMARLLEEFSEFTPGLIDNGRLNQLFERIKEGVESALDEEGDKGLSPNDLREMIMNQDGEFEDITEEFMDAIAPSHFDYAEPVYWEEEAEEPVDEGYAEARIKELIDFMNESMADMPSMYRRARMKMIIKVLPIYLDDLDEFFNYVHQALEFMPSDGVLLFIESRLDSLMEDEEDEKYEEDEDER